MIILYHISLNSAAYEDILNDEGYSAV